jgi:hypothetical protein
MRALCAATPCDYDGIHRNRPTFFSVVLFESSPPPPVSLERQDVPAAKVASHTGLDSWGEGGSGGPEYDDSKNTLYMALNI